MKIIQLILVPALILLTVLYFRRFRSILLDRAIIIFLCAAGVLLVLFPEISDKAAHMLGVGRGSDLVIYLSVVGIVFMIMGLLSKIRHLEERLTQLARNQAIDQGKMLSQEKKEL